MKVAFTSATGAVVDGDFSKSKSYSVWDIGAREAYYVTTVNITSDAVNSDDRIAARAEALKDCVIIYAMQINGPAAAKLAARMIHPMKTGERIAIERIIGKLQEILVSPAPWIRKAQLKEAYLLNNCRDQDGFLG
jgi:nitrogen fixation protein NifX